MSRAVKQYLNIYAEPEVHLLESFPPRLLFTHSVVIPTYKEEDSFLHRFVNSELSHQNALLIVIINQPDSDNDPHPQIALQDKLLSAGQSIWSKKNLSLIKLTDLNTHLLIVDRYSSDNTIADNEGVGLARKIGADIATSLINKGSIISPWICSTDADAHLPNNYFSALPTSESKIAAICYDFHHIDNQNDLSTATLLYEKALRYYVNGLKWAGSPYAFHTIGSTMAFHYRYYTNVRGVPKRSAGEDFYLLNKLAKQAAVINLTKASIAIEPRLSNRVPFGTGPAVEDIMALDDPTCDYLYYHPQLFIELKSCLIALSQLWHYKGNFNTWFGSLPEEVKFGLEQLNINKLLIHLQSQSNSEAQYQDHTRQWFDAFRTLKFIHYLQDKFHPPMALSDAISMSDFSID